MQKQLEKVYKKTFPQSGKVVKIVPKLLLFHLCGQYDIYNNKDYGYHKKPAHNRQEHPGTVARIRNERERRGSEADRTAKRGQRRSDSLGNPVEHMPKASEKVVKTALP